MNAKYRIIKLGSMFLFHLLFTFLLIRIHEFFFDACREFTICGFITVFTAVAFCMIYQVLMWKDHHSYHYLQLLNASNTVKVIKNLLLTAIIVLVFVNLILFLLNRWIQPLPPGMLLQACIQLLLMMTGFFLLYLAQMLWIFYLAETGYVKKQVLILGKPDARYPVDSLFTGTFRLKIFKGSLYREEGEWVYCTPDGITQTIQNAEIESLLYDKPTGELMIFLCNNITEEDIYRFIHFCHQNRLGYYLIPDIHTLPREGSLSKKLKYIPLVGHYNGSQDSLILISCKRIFDLMLAILILLFSFPLFIIISIAIKIEDGGPVLYTSKRVGKNGRVFDFYKFRSMVTDAEKRKKELWANNMRPDGPLFKMKNDPRVTRIGHILRELCLDELPQLFNILKGDLSFVGPRPHLVDEVAGYANKDKLRLECMPGMTCLPQIYDRNKIGFKKWVELDLFYRRHWSLFLDIKILFKSIFVVFYSAIFYFKEK